MTNDEKLIAARLLRMASDKFSSHGCNDFELENTHENYFFLIAAVGEDDYRPIINPEENVVYALDFVCMRYCAELLEQEVKNDS